MFVNLFDQKKLWEEDLAEHELESDFPEIPEEIPVEHFEPDYGSDA